MLKRKVVGAATAVMLVLAIVLQLEGWPGTLETDDAIVQTVERDLLLMQSNTRGTAWVYWSTDKAAFAVLTAHQTQGPVLVKTGSSGRLVKAKLIERSTTSDLAVIRIAADAAPTLPYSCDPPQIGDMV